MGSIREAFRDMFLSSLAAHVWLMPGQFEPMACDAKGDTILPIPYGKATLGLTVDGLFYSVRSNSTETDMD